jgi:hypothetical protein
MKQWDVFISHASEDKETVVLPLAELLRNGGLKVWVDKQQIKLGDSLREKIDEALANSRFGVVVLSPAFLAKDWTTRELNGLSALEERGHKVILPVWHNMTKPELAKHSPMLADRLATSTGHGLSAVAKQITDVVLAPDSGSPSSIAPSLPRLVANLVESNAEPETIYRFLLMHECLVQKISNRSPMPHVKPMPASAEWTAPGFLVWVDHHLHGGSTSVLLGPVNSPLFKADGSPASKLLACVTRAAEWQKQVAAGAIEAEAGMPIPAPMEVRILAGRRDLWPDADVNGIGKLRDLGVVVRSYDLLVSEAIGVP